MCCLASGNCVMMCGMRLQEIELLRSLSFDANIVQFYGACLQEENTMMVLEYMAVSTSIACFYMYFLHTTCDL